MPSEKHWRLSTVLHSLNGLQEEEKAHSETEYSALSLSIFYLFLLYGPSVNVPAAKLPFWLNSVMTMHAFSDNHQNNNDSIWN